jgi:uncharacterized protein (TIGR02996 family)
MGVPEVALVSHAIASLAADPTERAFLEAIQASPGDTARRLIYADWLEERGNPRAEFVRLDAALRRGGGMEPGPGWIARWRRLRSELSREWQALFGHLFSPAELAARLSVAPRFAEASLEVVDETTDVNCQPGCYRVLTVVRGLASSFECGADFWLQACRQNWTGFSGADIYLPRHECLPLPEAAWERAADPFLRNFAAPLPNGWRGEFIAALSVRVKHEAGEALAAAYSEEYVALFDYEDFNGPLGR